MCTHDFRRVDGQVGNYNSAAHESLRAVFRCMIVNFGKDEGRSRAAAALKAMDASHVSDLSEFGANWLRKFLEKQLPIRGDYAS